jgi:hypothetical protein
MKRRAALLSLATLSLTALAGEKQLFNGKDLTGWDGNTKLWSVEDGAITGKAGFGADDKIAHNTFLILKDLTPGDFELTFKIKLVGGYSGLQYRSKVQSQGPWGPIVGGYQAEFDAENTYSGMLLEERGRGIFAKRGEKVTVPAGGRPQVTGSLGDAKELGAAITKNEWNDYKVVAKGSHLQHFINGKQTVDVTDEDAAKSAKDGVIALQLRAGFQMTVQFKDLVLKTEDK